MDNTMTGKLLEQFKDNQRKAKERLDLDARLIDNMERVYKEAPPHHHPQAIDSVCSLLHKFVHEIAEEFPLCETSCRKLTYRDEVMPMLMQMAHSLGLLKYKLRCARMSDPDRDDIVRKALRRPFEGILGTIPEEPEYNEV